jgi:two-component system, response regulator PdtaR
MSGTVICLLNEELLGSSKKWHGQGFPRIVASGSLGELYDDAMSEHAGVAVIEHSADEGRFSQTLKKLWERTGIQIIIIAESVDFDSILKWGESMIAAILAKPVREEELVAAIALLLARGNQINQLRDEISSLKENIESRKLVEKAKGRLMERDHLSESEAFLRMRRLSMDRRISMRQLSEAILLTDRIGA